MTDNAASPAGEAPRPNATTTDAESCALESKPNAAHENDVELPETKDDGDRHAGKGTFARRLTSHVNQALIAGIIGVLTLAGLSGWLGYRWYESNRAETQRDMFLEVGRQGALNLTTIDFQHADADVQRILDSATGTFYDDFQQRAEPFVQVVKQAQSKTVGTVAEAGVESYGDSGAQVLVAVTVQTTNAAAPEPQPRAWRMRISVHEIDGEAKVSNVEFVP